jgi:O-antigen ligase
MQLKAYNKKNERSGSWHSLIPLVFLVAIVPLIVFCKVITLKGASYAFWVGSKQNYDFFSYNKMVWILISTGAAIATLIIRMLSGKLKIKKIWLYIPMGAYSFFVIISALLSKYKDVSLIGFTDRYEGMFVILSYIIIMFITINMVENEKHVKILLYALLASATVMGILGVFQYFNMDIFQTAFGKSLILPSKYENLADKIKFTLGPRTVYGTLYHYNYMGSYMAMLTPLAFVLFIYSKNKKMKIVFGAIALLMAFNLFACRSRAGIVGGSFALLMFVIVSWKAVIRQWKILIAAVLGVVVIFIGANAVTKGGIATRISSIFWDIERNDNLQATHGIKDIVVGSNSIKIMDTSAILTAKVSGQELHFEDENGNVLHAQIKNGEITLKNEKYSKYKFYMEKQKGYNVLRMVIENDKMDFAVTPEGFKYIAGNGVLVDPKPVEKFGFEGREKMGSSRAYIWSRSLPLLKHTIVAGYGPDTFAIYFPQYDYIGKLKAYGTASIIVDKPHNLYLQNAINTGVFSLISLLILFIGYFVQSVKAYFNNKFENFYSIAGLAIFTAICGYLGAGFFNDSVVSVAPVFWVLLGLGTAINLKLVGDGSLH